MGRCRCPDRLVRFGGAAENDWFENMKALLTSTLVALAILTLPGLAGAENGPDTVADVRVEGNEYMSDQAVLHHVKTRVGNPYNEDVLKADELRLLETGRFSSVKVHRTLTSEGVVVTFEVTEHPTIDSIEITNNKGMETKRILRDLPYGQGDPLSDFTVESNRKAIERLYRDEGYQFVEVTSTVRHRQVAYNVVEGPRVNVAKVIYEGNTHFSAWTLNQRIGTHRAWWPFIKGPLDLGQVDRDVNTLRASYKDEGFLGAEVSYRLEYNDDKSKVTVIFVIEQHDRYRVNQVVFEGNTAFSDRDLMSRITLAQGRFITALQLRQDTQALISTYGEVGYISASVDSEISYLNPDLPPPAWAAATPGRAALVNVVFHIEEHDQYSVGRIDIRGNTVTHEHVIRRELRIYPEQPVYNTVAVERSEQKLMDLRLFDEVSIDPVAAEGRRRNVLVTVKEARTAEFLVGVGVSSQSGLLGNISFTQRNFDITGWRRKDGQGQLFKGAGQTFSVVAEPGTELMRFKIEWFEPYLFDQPYSLGAKAYLFERGRDTYDELRYGPVVSLGHMLRSRWYVELAGRIEGIDIGDLDEDAPPEVLDVEGNSWVTAIKASLIKDRTDSRWMPTTGDRIAFSFEQAVGDFSFSTLEASYRWYRTLYTDALDRKHYIATKVQYGQIFGDAPVFEKFYGGGIGSIRGFEYRGISPRSKGTDHRIGGDFLFLAGAEYNFPIYGKMFRGVVFLDTGTVEEDFGMTTYRAALGAGLRWTIPMMGPVPIQLDFAVPLAKDDEDDEQVFSFSIGWTF